MTQMRWPAPRPANRAGWYACYRRPRLRSISLPNICQAFALYPHISIELVTPGPVEVADENFDLSIISIGQQTLQGDFIIRRLARSSFVICASPEYLARHGRPQQPADLRTHQGLLPSVSAIRRELTLYRDATAEQFGPSNGSAKSADLAEAVEAAGAAGAAGASGDAEAAESVESTALAAANRVTMTTPAATLLTSNIDVLYASALAGLGIAGLPTFVVEQALRDGRLERVLLQWRGIHLSLYAAMPTRKHVPMRTRALIDYLVQTFGGTDRDPWLIGES